MFVNPGGPGGSAVDAVFDPSVWPAELRDRFDIVGFDPRGVGFSGQVQCWSPARYLREYAQASGRARGGHRAFRKTISQATQFANACKKHADDVLPYLGTYDLPG